VAVALLSVRPALPAPVAAFGDARAPTLHDPLDTRLRYERALVANAEYLLALEPRTITLWRWRLDVLPAHPDLQRAWDETRRIAPVSLDQPDAVALLWSIQRAYQQLARDVWLAQQAPGGVAPDYSRVHTLLDVLDTDLAAALAGPPVEPSTWRACPVCALE
jgi:hypothetical protein